jgi:hypothetical protein
MRASYQNWILAQSGVSTSFREVNAPTKGVDPRLLINIYPRHLPGRVINIRASHKFKKLFGWIICKGTLQKLSKLEREFLQVIILDTPERYYEWSKILLRIQDQPQFKRWDFLDNSWILFPDLVPREPIRFLRSFEPALEFSWFWFDPKKPPPKRYMGVGYTDQGTLGSGLSWKSQILPEEEEYSDLKSRIQVLRKISRL